MWAKNQRDILSANQFCCQFTLSGHLINFFVNTSSDQLLNFEIMRRVLLSGILPCVEWYFIDVMEEDIASIFRVEV
jgi:hypothetical protein